MEDIYLEYLIKKKKSGKQMAIIALIIAAAAVVSLALLYVVLALGYMAAAAQTPYGSFIFSIGLVLIAMVCYGAYLLINMQNIEFEYILTNSELDIDKVLSKKGRKSFAGFDFKNIIICAAVEDAEHKNEYNTQVEKTYDAVGDYERGGVYFADYMSEGGRMRVLFQPTSKMIKAAWKFNPRNIFVKED